MLLGIGISLVVGYLVVRDVDWGALSGQFDHFPIGYALASLLIFSVATALRAYRWQVLFLGDKVPLHRLLLVQNAGIGLNSISPVRVISEAVQFILLTLRYRVKKEEVAATLGLQRVLDFVIGALLMGIGLILLPHLQGFAIYALGAGVLAVVSLLAVPIVIWFGTRPGLTHLKLLASTSSSLRSLIRARIELAFSFLLTLSYWLTMGLSAWVLAYGMGIEISFLVATLLVIGTLTFVALVPSLPASVGTFEFAVYDLLTAVGVGKAEALGFALVIHAILFMPPIVSGVLVLAGWPLKRRTPERDPAEPSPGRTQVQDAGRKPFLSGIATVPARLLRMRPQLVANRKQKTG